VKRKKNDYLQQAIDLENELIEAQRKRAKKVLMDSEEFKAASNSERKTILKKFDKITEGMKKVQEEAKKTSLFDTEAWQQGMSLAEASIGAFDEISDAALEVSRKHAEEQIAIIDSALQELQKQIEDVREKQLEAEGFIEAQSEEAFDKQIEAAKAAGDEVLQYQLQHRKQEMGISGKPALR
jgi:phosphomevalonate kinase